ncbi:DUF481 domain-containing protein [Aliikangiella coralliicola]|uniref:DUF481 domain-containing protein n=1 Tax=Aliikangiella coralliicola TaxID=2592383 RepID=A0A545U4U3_9GAMM|nr:DUF481 domain-containing protein [Aliikangiella coralliicola]TQV84489.1 DUF481 domain-containing protein [Aliikangiella coralliicola]
MTNYFKKIPTILALGLISSSAFADDFFLGKPASSEEVDENCEQTEQGCEGKWAGSVEFGYVAVSGDNESDSLNGRFTLGYEVGRWRHAGALATQSSSTEDSNGVKTEARKFTAQAKSDYKFSKYAYAFGIADYDDTKDSGFDYQASLALGAGYRFIEDESHTLDGELGFGTRESKIEATSETNSEGIVRLAGLYKWKINKNAEFEQKLSSEIGDDNTVSKSYSGLSANIMESLALKVSYSVKHQSDVPVGNEKTESVTSFTVVYSF